MAEKKVNRRRFISSTAAGALAAAAVSREVSASAAGKDRPNILWIIADDVGDGDLGCYGHPTMRTCTPLFLPTRLSCRAFSPNKAITP